MDIARESLPKNLISRRQLYPHGKGPTTHSLEGIIKISKFFNTNLWEFFLDDFGQIKHILPNFIEPDDAAMLKLLNAENGCL